MTVATTLMEMIDRGEIKSAIGLVAKPDDHHDAEDMVITVLNHEQSSTELIEAAMEAFYQSHQNKYNEHGEWVHCLSHFIGALWEKRQIKWIKILMATAFRGANELHSTVCCDRLVNNFGKYARFDDDPTDFYCTPENLGWLDWECMDYAKARIEAGKFPDEGAFLNWQLAQPCHQTDFHFESQMKLVDVAGLQIKISRLRELGLDTESHKLFINNLLIKQLDKLKKDRDEAVHEWQLKRIKIALQKTRDDLVKI